MFTELLLTLITILLLWFILENYFPARKYAPGPFRLPFIGSALSLILNRATPPFILFQKFSKRYGPVCYLSTGQRKMVIIDDFETAKQILNHETWINRPYNKRIGERSFGKPLGIIFVNGDGWKEMRRFSMRTLRDFGYGKQTSMQAVLDDEVKALASKVELVATSPEPIMEVKHLFTMPVLNILWSMVSNIRTAEDDVKLRKLIKLVDNLAKANPIAGNILSIFPFLRFIFPVWTGHTMAQKCHKELQEYFRDILERRRSEGGYGEDKRDFIDSFIQEIDKHSKIGSNPNHYTDEQFITTITDLFEAGSETSSNTMEFAIYFCIKNPSVQKKVQKEIDKVFGHNRYPDAAERNQMPYTEATLLEIQRMANVLPVTVRSPTEDCTLDGYHVPKGTAGIVNIYSIHMDPAFWKDPFMFRPERFLDDKMKIIPEKANRVIPFGAGKRLCLGEQMARFTLFSYFTSLLQHYTFEDVTNDNTSPQKMELQDFVDVGFTLSPKPYLVKVIKR